MTKFLLPVLPSKEKVCVIPGAVNASSIRVEGTWQKFNVTWNPVKNVNFGQVFYEVKIRSSGNTELVVRFFFQRIVIKCLVEGANTIDGLYSKRRRGLPFDVVALRPLTRYRLLRLHTANSRLPSEQSRFGVRPSK